MIFVVLVCGDRYYKDYERVNSVLVNVISLFADREKVLLVEGACHLGGADQLAHDWANRFQLMTKRYLVDTRIDGPWPGAGTRRNMRMYDDAKPQLTIGFPGGNGTRNMLNYAWKKGCKTSLCLVNFALAKSQLSL